MSRYCCAIAIDDRSMRFSIHVLLPGDELLAVGCLQCVSRVKSPQELWFLVDKQAVNDSRSLENCQSLGQCA